MPIRLEQWRAVVQAIRAERASQDEKWGDQSHEDELWLAILMEEVGELAESILHKRFGGDKSKNRRKELVQVAAVAAAWLQHVQRQGGAG